MLVESSEEPPQLRKNVTSPNGTTHAALVSFEKSGLKAIVDGAVKAATSRAETDCSLESWSAPDPITTVLVAGREDGVLPLHK